MKQGAQDLAKVVLACSLLAGCQFGADNANTSNVETSAATQVEEVTPEMDHKCSAEDCDHKCGSEKCAADKCAAGKCGGDK